MKESITPLHFDFEVDSTNEELFEREPSIKSVKFSEGTSLLINAIALVISAVTQFHFKYIKITYPQYYEEYSFCFWRYFWSAVINYAYMQYTKETLQPFSSLRHNVWFWVRTIDQFVVFETLLFLISFFRVSTAACFVSMAPVVILILSTVILGEKFYMRYLYGIIICAFGTFLIVSNEKKQGDGSGPSISFWGIILGTFWGLVQLTSVALHRVSSKMLVKDKIDENTQIMYPSFACCILPVICIVLLGKQFSYHWIFVFHCGFNGFLWILFTRFLVISLRGVDLIKTTAIGYLATMTVFILSAMFLGEKVYFTDIVGSLCIVGYNIYNTVYPVKES